MIYRSRTDIACEILAAANGGATKTKIMYKAYISYAQLKEYFAMLINSDLLAHNAAENTYKTTPKGVQLQKLYAQIHTFALSAKP